MKSKIAGLTLLLALVAGFYAFTPNAGEPLGKPKQVDGVYVFVMSEPAGEYYKLGQVGSGISSQFNAMIKTIVKNVKSQYGDANGVIVDTEKSTVVGYAIKLK